MMQHLALSESSAMLIRPESDWSVHNREFVHDFEIVARFASHDLTMDIRQYEWVRPSAGHLLPQKHYLDISLDGSLRRSLLQSERWDEPQFSGGVLYLPPNVRYWGQPALEKRNLLCVSFGDAFLDNVFDGENPLTASVPHADIQNVALRRYLLAMASELSSPGFAAGTLLESLAVGATVELARWSQLVSDPGAGWCCRIRPSGSRNISGAIYRAR
ncbi:hypothetical protein [Novosphingobium sp. MMS21-SN21R]|uniref:hypothetical protein n=1 Tax=Novosphingobium sp. MMS21-SN21R TaxID=2969298 RepID=UPI002887CA7A|nr:hypothetical protein [Novosphingobium sp. MMS21-SN21R]MDT0509619.1 hypothetical protein [Novosphingobium sp. MMS21-SN21R]